jgi:hypothetical protein
MVLQLGNSANWEQVYFSTVNAAQVNPQSHTPIPLIVVPVQLESPILAVYVSCTPPKPTWYFAGWLNQKVFTGLTVGGVTDAENVQRRKIWLNKITLIRLDKLSDSYSITFSVPKWFQSISLQVWEYTGPIDNPDYALEKIVIDLQRIEGKIDDISSYGGA